MFSTTTPPWLIITDLDGTLLDHHSYDHSPALPALDVIEQLNLPLIFNSSKTAAEITDLRGRLNNSQPYVVENGGGILIPAAVPATDQEITLGIPRHDILNTLQQLREQHQYAFTGFHDLDARALSNLTGLDQAAAERAQQRQFSEPILWQEDEQRWQKFVQQLAAAKLIATRGGRFISIAGDSNKGKALTWLVEHFRGTDGVTPKTIALGDGENDRSMLELADIAVVIPNPHHPPLALSTSAYRVAEEPGPVGWKSLYDRHHQYLYQELIWAIFTRTVLSPHCIIYLTDPWPSLKLSSWNFPAVAHWR